VHNASLDSSDLTISAELTARTAAAVERLIPEGARWFLHEGRTAPDPGWSGPDFEPTPRTTGVEFSAPGDYVFELAADDGTASDTATIAVTVLAEDSEDPFRRGDADGGGGVDITDAIAILSWLFLGDDEPLCLDAADADDDGHPDLSDAIRILSWLFTGGPAPASPGPTDCGPDPGPDELPACEYPECG